MLLLVMPTYFGPTNIPPLDAWANELPVIYSNTYLNKPWMQLYRRS